MTRGILAATTLFIAATAGAAATPGIGEQFESAVSDLDARFGPVDEHRLPPSETDPKVITDIAVINQARNQFGTTAFPVAFPATFNSVCLPLQKLTMRYLSAGLTSNDMAGANAAKSIENSHRYQMSLVPIISFNFKCMALHMPEFQTFWQNLPDAERTAERKRGIALTRNGVEGIVLGAAISTLETGVTRANRGVMADVAAAHTGQMVSILPLARRRQLLVSIDNRARSFKTAWPAQYAKVRKALLDPTCVSICLVS